jgi:hypothetical protein
MAVDQSTEAGDGEAAVLAAMERKFGGGPEAEAEEAAEAETQGTETEATDGQEPAEGAEAQSEEVEVEIEGEKYLVPKKISDRFIQHADYTRKTQDLAELRRATSAEREVMSINKAFDQAVAGETSSLAVVRGQIAQYKQLDWQAMDTEQLLKARAQLDRLKDQEAELDTSIKAKRTEFDKRIEGHVQEALQAGEKYCQQHIKGWNEQTKKDLFDFGVSIGYTRAEMDRITDPRIVVSLHEQKMWRDLQTSKPGTLKRASQAAPVVRPGASQRQPSRIQQLSKAVKSAKGEPAKKQAAEDYFTAKFGGG